MIAVLVVASVVTQCVGQILLLFGEEISIALLFLLANVLTLILAMAFSDLRTITRAMWLMIGVLAGTAVCISFVGDPKRLAIALLFGIPLCLVFKLQREPAWKPLHRQRQFE